MATKHRKKSGRNHSRVEKGGFPFSWNGLNKTLNTLEKEVGKAYRQFSHSLPKPIEKRLKEIQRHDLLKLAQKQQKTIVKEVKHYAGGLVKTLNRADFLPNQKKLTRMAKTNGNKLLGMLDFPTKKDVAKLSARLNKLETQFKRLSRRA